METSPTVLLSTPERSERRVPTSDTQPAEIRPSLGCGMHVEQVLPDVGPEERGRCNAKRVAATRPDEEQSHRKRLLSGEARSHWADPVTLGALHHFKRSLGKDGSKEALGRLAPR